MTCDELRDDYELHAIGLDDEPERSEIDDHLRRGCAACTAGMKRARGLNADLLALVPAAEPPKRLRRRVLASVGAGTSRSPWVWLGVPAGVLAGLLVGMLLRQPSAAPPAETAQLHQLLEVLNDPATKAVTFSPGPHGRVFVNPSHGVLLLANNMPELPKGKTFELWVIPKGAAPKPAGLFKADRGGNAVYRTTAPLDVTGLGAVAVSVEPEAGSQAPTTTPIIVAPIAD